MTPGELLDWVFRAEPGSRVCYGVSSTGLPVGLRRTALAAWESGYLHLIQRRVRGSDFAYLAERSRVPVRNPGKIRRCPSCGGLFEASGAHNRRYCSDLCRAVVVMGRRKR